VTHAQLLTAIDVRQLRKACNSPSTSIPGSPPRSCPRPVSTSTIRLHVHFPPRSAPALTPPATPYPATRNPRARPWRRRSHPPPPLPFAFTAAAAAAGSPAPTVGAHHRRRRGRLRRPRGPLSRPPLIPTPTTLPRPHVLFAEPSSRLCS